MYYIQFHNRLSSSSYYFLNCSRSIRTLWSLGPPHARHRLQLPHRWGGLDRRVKQRDAPTIPRLKVWRGPLERGLRIQQQLWKRRAGYQVMLRLLSLLSCIRRQSPASGRITPDTGCLTVKAECLMDTPIFKGWRPDASGAGASVAGLQEQRPQERRLYKNVLLCIRT